ncbi:hypothetical protein [Pelagibaculum spongiae]|uniref:hypothetical protein n=1 Tax=Pelagibaculum spongiae TaxID=2080658 RepID=UPI000E30FC63|nr:hypothetical protein [Pelagibaculum spongiae]
MAAAEDTIYNSGLDWHLVNEKTSFKVADYQMPGSGNECSSTGDAFEFFGVNCDFRAIFDLVFKGQFKVVDAEDGFDVLALVERQVSNTTARKLKTVNQYRVEEQALSVNFKTNFSKHEDVDTGLVSYDVTMKFSNDIWKNRAVAKGSYGVGLVEDYYGKDGVTISGSYHGRKDIDDSAVNGYEIDGGFDFEVIQRSDEAVSMQAGKNFFYKFTNAFEKTVCAVPGATPSILDADCDGVAE